MKLLRWISILLVSVFILSCNSNNKIIKQENNNLTNVSVGDLRNEFWSPLYIAKELDYFKDEGLKVDLVEFDNESTALKSLQENGINFTTLSMEETLIGFENNQKSKILIATMKNSTAALISNENIKYISDLKNQIVVSGAPGSLSYAFVSSILKKNNLTPNKDVKLIDMNRVESLVALENDQIQATFLDSTRINQSETLKMNVLVNTTDNKVHEKIYGADRYEKSLIIASPRFIKKSYSKIC